MPSLAHSEDPDKMPHNVAFHQGLHYLLRPKQYSEDMRGSRKLCERGPTLKTFLSLVDVGHLNCVSLVCQ